MSLKNSNDLPVCSVVHPLLSIEVKERVEVDLYSPSGPFWPVIGFSLSQMFLHFLHMKVVNGSAFLRLEVMF